MTNSNHQKVCFKVDGVTVTQIKNKEYRVTTTGTSKVLSLTGSYSSLTKYEPEFIAMFLEIFVYSGIGKLTIEKLILFLDIFLSSLKSQILTNPSFVNKHHEIIDEFLLSNLGVK